MKFKEVTWYSKLLAAVLFITLPFVAFYLGVKYQESLKPNISVQQISTSSKKDATSSAKPKDKDDLDSRAFVKKIDNEKLSISVVVVDGALKYSGAVRVPTPCHEVKGEVVVAESFPEQVQIRLTVEDPDPAQVCALVVTNKEFSGEVKVSEKATVSIYLDGEKVD